MHDTAHRTSGRILLAEDHPINQRVATAMLEKLGYHVDVVADGPAAVKSATLTPYRAILMDCHLPGLDGCGATTEIRRLEGASRRTPIIAVTASARSDRQRCLDAGMDDFLAKPLSLKALAAVLARWVPDAPQLTIAAEPAESFPGTHVGAADAARPVLDSRVIDRLERLGTAAGEDLIGQLTVLFLDDAVAQITALRDALTVGDAAAVAGSAHSLRGASANLGATDLARLCATLEADAAAGDLVDAGARLVAIEAELERVRSALGSPAPTP